jgi:hypothetical protein
VDQAPVASPSIVVRRASESTRSSVRWRRALHGRRAAVPVRGTGPVRLSALGWACATGICLSWPAAVHSEAPAARVVFNPVADPDRAAHVSLEEQMRELYNERSHRIYNSLFPYHAEVCTVTRYRQRARTPGGRKNTGGRGGHATLFLHGACRDDKSAIPQLRLCGDEVDLTDADSGVGVSVNQVFRNVVWNAIPGRRAFFHGGAEPDEELTWKRYERAIEEFAAKPWFDGIELRPREMEVCACRNLGAKDCFDDTTHGGSQRGGAVRSGLEELELGEAERRRCVVRESIGTDFALTFARTALCARVALNRSALQAMVDELNERNISTHRELIEKGVSHVWDGLTDNCSHLVANAFAATGMIEPKDVRRPSWWSKLLTAASHLKPWGGDLSLPVHTFVHVAEAGWELPIESVFRLYQNPFARQTLERHEWISTGPGSLIEVIRIRPGAGWEEGNRVFREGEPGIDVLKTGVLSHYTNYVSPVKVRTNPLKLQTALRPDPSYREYYSDLCKGLLHFRRRLRSAQDEMRTFSEPGAAHRQLLREWSHARATSADQARFETFLSHYRRYVEATLASLEQDLDRYRALAGDDCRARSEENEGDPLHPAW